MRIWPWYVIQELRNNLEKSREDLIRLQEINKALSTAMSNAGDKAMQATNRMAEAVQRECQIQESMKEMAQQVANYAVLASGSRVPIFPGVGPTSPPPPIAKEGEQTKPMSTRRRASEVVAGRNTNFLAEYLAEQEAQKL